jgi:hypothetical protein
MNRHGLGTNVEKKAETNFEISSVENRWKKFIQFYPVPSCFFTYWKRRLHNIRKTCPKTYFASSEGHSYESKEKSDLRLFRCGSESGMFLEIGKLT